MLKFLRLYQGWILAVFGTFLVITFLLPQAIQGLFQSYAVTGGDWATVGQDETVTNGQLQVVRGELLVQDVLPTQTVPRILGADQDPSYWYLLSREAEQAGLVGGVGVGRDFLASVSAALVANGQQVSETMLLLQMMGSANFTDRQVYETLAKVQGVMQLAGQYETAARFSDERLRQAAAQLALSASADLVIIDAASDPSATEDTATEDGSDPETTDAAPAILAVDPPDEAALQAQFERHRSENPGEGESGFGYRLPDRAGLEWIVVDKEAVREAVAANTTFDPIELRKAFINDPLAYGAVSSGGEPPRFADYSELVRDRMLEERVDARMREIEKFLSDQTQLPRRGLERSGMTYVLPEDWNSVRANLGELATALGEEFSMDAPMTDATPELLGAREIDQLPGIGTARSTKFGRRPTSAAEYAMAAAEFGRESTIPAQTGVAGPVFTDPAGNLYLFRVTETDPAREANSLDEVRDQVVADATTVARFEKLESMAADLESQAVEYGLQPIAEAHDTEVRVSPQIAEADAMLLGYGIKQPTRIMGLRDAQTVVDAVVKRAAELDYTVPAADIPIAERTLVIPDRENLALVVVQITGVTPLTRESWTELSANAGITRVLATEETALDFRNTYSLESLVERHDFKLLRAQEDDELIEDAEIEGLDAAPVGEAEATTTTTG